MSRALRKALRADLDLRHEASIHPSRYFARQNPSLYYSECGQHLPGVYVENFSLDFGDPHADHFVGSVGLQYRVDDSWSSYAHRWVLDLSSGKTIAKPFTHKVFAPGDVENQMIAFYLEERVQRLRSQYGVDDHGYCDFDGIVMQRTEGRVHQALVQLVNDLPHLAKTELERAIQTYQKITLAYDQKLAQLVLDACNWILFDQVYAKEKQPSLFPSLRELLDERRR